MKRIEDIKEFKDIDTYYEISEIVNEVFQDRVETHKHLVTANKEIERLNNIINELEKELDRGYLALFEHELVLGRKLITNIKNYLQELKDSEK